MTPVKGGLAAVVLIGVVAMVLSAQTLQAAVAPGVLLDPIAPALWCALIGAGLCAATVLSVVALRRAKASGRQLNGTLLLNLLGAVGFVCFVLPAATLRDGVQWAAFVRSASPPVVQPFVVVGTHLDWWSKRNAYFVDVRMPSEPQPVALRATVEAYDAVRLGAQISLPVQVGRGGMRRVIAPFPLTLADVQAG